MEGESACQIARTQIEKLEGQVDLLSTENSGLKEMLQEFKGEQNTTAAQLARAKASL
jgi:hypothetical protein